jgi:hypothetical protein
MILQAPSPCWKGKGAVGEVPVVDLNPIKKGASLLFYLNITLQQITA